ncbi:MAG: glucose-6-phosphate dehydrogenase [Acidobacteriota bacterium]
MVVFGAGGDLTERKLVPALYNLAAGGLLPREFAIIGLARSEREEGKFRDKLRQGIEEHVAYFNPALVERLLERTYYIAGDYRDAAVYERLRRKLSDADRAHGTGGNYLFYLATPPSFFCETVRQLGQAGLAAQADGRWRRVIIEKPFGHDLDSARCLNRDIREVLEESQIYRIDHYLGKETVQNILVFRFSNGIFEPIWNRRYVDHVQITVVESIGVEHRAAYYEEAGALRDMLPNHLFQLLALTAMEPPISFEANAVRDEKEKVLNAIQPIPPEQVLSRTVRGQYGEGTVDGVKVPAYRSEPRIAPDSNTETYVAMKLLIDSWRWADVPFYLRTGKRLKGRFTEIAIRFKRAPLILFRDTPIDSLAPNQLILRIQPQEGISLSFGAKVPGPMTRIGHVDMDFSYAEHFGHSPTTGYETLLYDCMHGDATLFQRADNVESAWRVVAPILDVWKALPARNFPNYKSGTWGPREADELLARDSRRWRNPV